MTKKKLTNNDVYEMANEKILEALEGGVNPWKKTWQALSTHGMPINLVNKKPYRGSNILMLGMQDVDCQCWVTFKQAKLLKGSVKKGARSSLVVYWKFLELEDKETKEKKKIPFLRYYRVFNALRDCEGLEEKVKAWMQPKEGNKPPMANPDEVIMAWMGNENIPLRHGGDRAFYVPSQDRVQMPFESDFDSRNHYISTLAHECLHATGHKSRLNRPGVTDSGSGFGTEKYSFEELIAETGACYVAASLGYEPDWDNTAAYLTSWKKKLKANPDWFVKASSKAEKGSNLILGIDSPWEKEKGSQVA